MMGRSSEERTGPLAGVKVVEFAGRGPGPFGAMLLADLGADVIRVVRVEEVATAPAGAGGATGDGAGAGNRGEAGLAAETPTERTLRGHRSIDLLARGRRSVALDLKAPAGLEAALRLVDAADVLVEGFRPGVA